MIRKSLALLVALAAVACATAPQPLPGGGVDLSDSEIAAIVRTAHEGEIQHGEVARNRASSADVRSFADMMVRDHGAALSRASEVLSRANIMAQDNETARRLRSSGQDTGRALGTYSGAEFDRQYMRAQVDMHDWLLRSLDTSLIPSARSPQLAELLRNQRTFVATHLEHARRVQQGLR